MPWWAVWSIRIICVSPPLVAAVAQLVGHFPRH
jgi:hypothetical protein